MLKIEKKLLSWVEKHMFLLMALLVAVVSLYLKKIAVWWISPDVNYYFDNHANSIQSAFYNVLVLLVQHVPMLPLHSIKWIAGIADYVVAVLCFIAVQGHREKHKLKCTFYFVVCMMSPIVYLRGICWGQPDAVAFAFLIGAYLLWEKDKKAIAMILAVIGVALYPCLVLFALGWIVYRCKETPGKDWIYAGILLLGGVLVQGVCGVILGNSWTEGIMSGFHWTTYNPYTGVEFKEPLLWMKQMVNLFGYGVAMVSGIAAYRHKISYVMTLIIHLIVLLVYASILFPVGI